MTYPDFIKKTNLDSFLNENAFNLACYERIKNNPVLCSSVEPVRFFNNLWYLHHLILLNKTKPGKIINYIRSMSMSDHQRFCVLLELLQSFKKTIDPGIRDESDFELQICLKRLTHEFETLGHRLFPDTFEKDFIFNFDIILVNLDFIPDLHDKLRCLFKLEAKYSEYSHRSHEELPDFRELLNAQVKCIRKILKYCPPPAALFIASQTGAQLRDRDYITGFLTDLFRKLHSDDWSHFFYHSSDYRQTINTFSDYFAGYEISLTFSIELRKRCKTLFCMAIQKIYEKLAGTDSLRKDTAFLTLLRNFSVFRGMTDQEIYTAVIRNKL